MPGFTSLTSLRPTAPTAIIAGLLLVLFVSAPLFRVFAQEETPPSAPTHLTAVAGSAELSLSWTAAQGNDYTITGYQYHWKAGEEEFGAWQNIPDSAPGEANETAYTVDMLTQGTSYTFEVRAVAGEVFGGPASVTATPGIAYDSDTNGLIEIGNLAQLNAVRWDLDGDGSSAESGYTLAFPRARTGMGCPSTGCIGYELTAGLDFDTDGNGSVDSGDDYWNGGSGWDPIGDSSGGFNAAFDGNRYTISNLFINRSADREVGLFGNTGSSADIRNVGLTGVNINGNIQVGGVAGHSGGSIGGSSVTGSVSGGAEVGGPGGHRRRRGECNRQLFHCRCNRTRWQLGVGRSGWLLQG